MAIEDFPPLFPQDDEDAIRARWNAWANEGLDPAAVSNEEWTDVREGSFFHMVTQPGVQESAREYDRMTETLAAALPQFAWGDYLDAHADSRGLDRNAATAAEGVARFSGPVGTVVPMGTAIAARAIEGLEDAPTFATLESATIPAGGFVDVPIRAGEVGVLGVVAAGALTIMETPITGVTVTNPASTFGGTDEEDDERLRVRVIDRYRVRGEATTEVVRGWALDEEGVTGASVLPQFYGPGSVLVVLTANNGPVAPGVVNAFQQRVDPAAVETTLTAGIAAGAGTIPVASTAGFRPLAPSASEPGFLRIGDNFVRYTGQTGTSFTGATGVVDAHASGDAVSQSGRSSKLAPPGMHVIVSTPSVLMVTLAAQIEPEPGYALDDDAGLRPLRDAMTLAVAEYVRSVPTGGEVVRQRVIAALMGVEGVHDVGTVTLNGSAANVAVTADPPRVADLAANPTFTTATL